jgi:hypothetical protein
MFETVSVDEAIQKGRRMVVYPRLVLFFTFMLVVFFWGIFNQQSGGYVFLGMGAGLLAGWLYWNITSTRWKVWAYDNVRNVHELQKRAVKEGIIAKEGGFWDKTVIKSADDRQKLDALQSKFDVPDVFVDDLQIPAETQIFFSKSKNLFGLISGLLVLLGGVVMMILTKEFESLIFVAVGGYLAYKEYKNLADTDPQITLNAGGISTSSAPFYNWNDITDEDVILVSHGKSSSHNLVYSYPEGSVSLDIGPLGVTHHELENLLRIYRGRSEEKVKH